MSTAFDTIRHLLSPPIRDLFESGGTLQGSQYDYYCRMTERIISTNTGADLTSSPDWALDIQAALINYYASAQLAGLTQEYTSLIRSQFDNAMEQLKQYRAKAPRTEQDSRVGDMEVFAL